MNSFHRMTEPHSMAVERPVCAVNYVKLTAGKLPLPGDPDRQKNPGRQIQRLEWADFR